MLRRFAVSCPTTRCIAAAAVAAIFPRHVQLQLVSAPSLINTVRWCSSATSKTPTPGADDDDSYTFDVASTITKDALLDSQDAIIAGVVAQWLPPNTPADIVEKATKYLKANPIDEAIAVSRIRITHVEDETTGEAKSMKLPETTRDEAIQSAREQGKHLVQMFEKEGVAFCRVRNEKPRLLKHCGISAEAAVDGAAAGTGAQQDAGGEAAGTDSGDAAAGAGGQRPLPKRLRDQVEHMFRDVVDDHFIGWKSKAIVTKDLERGHPVRLCIQKFASPEAAVVKMKQMLAGVKKAAEESGSVHAYTGLHISDKEIAITLTPKIAPQPGEESKAPKITALRHPTENEWNRAEERFVAACQKSGRDRIGTYTKSEALKPRNLGARQFRTDKYGRRIG